ncbi:MAG: adenylate/guanylate cyclase domain-containing protein [Cyclobacteriaceae bacterium]
MESPVLIRKRRNSALILMSAGTMAGLVYTFFSADADKPMSWVNAIVVGCLLGVFVSIIENRVFGEQLRRKLSFINILIVRIVVYAFLVLIILLLILSVSRVFWFELNYADVWRSEEFQNYLFHGDFKVAFFFCLGLIALVVFSYQITRKLGQGYLENIITGRYYQPRLEERVFCFLKLHGISAVARRLDHDHYYDLINDIIYDITEIILSYNGIIYQYVEEDMVIHWVHNKAIANGNCIRCFFAIRDKLYQRREYYLNEYEYFPEVLGAIHAGTVVRGEIGQGKMEIAFYGDPLNTTSRILDKATIDANLLISNEIIDRIEVPNIFKSKPFGSFVLEGKSKELEIFTISEKALKTMP